MKRILMQLVTAIALLAGAGLGVFGQGTTSSISGVVVDQSGAVIPGAEVTVKNDNTGLEFKTVSAENGTFSAPGLATGNYTVTVALQGFKTSILKDVKLDAATPATVRAILDVGTITETVTVTGGAEMVQSQTATVSSTIQNKQITNLPLATRNTLDFLVMMPGVNTTASARNSTINGLPSVTINITVDGVNTQDNYNRNGDGFFSYISPRLDAMEEVSISTATPGAESAGQGAVQIKFVTRSGNNQYHGSIYEYHRNPWLNGNYWFNNRDKAPLCNDGKNACPDRYLLNQFGGRVGGPISIPGLFSGKDKAFFFLNIEQMRLPNQMTRTKTIYHPNVLNGIFRYTVGSTVNEVDLMKLAAANGQTSTFDPTIKGVLDTVRKSTSAGTLNAQTNPLYDNFTFTNGGMQVRTFPTARIDINLTKNHRLEGTWNYSKYGSTPDLLNNVDPAFPGSENLGTQGGPRFQGSIAWRATLSNRLVNEARVGLTGGITIWYGNVAPSMLDYMGSYVWTPYGNSAPWIVRSSQRRSTPTENFDDTLTWIKGSHSLSFGGSFTNIGSFFRNQTFVPSISLGVNGTLDPARILFDSVNGLKNFPGASTAQIADAAGVYATLTGRVTAITANAILNEDSLKYSYMGQTTQRAHQRELAFFAADSWRAKSNLTLNFGLRWELQLPWVPLNDVYSWATEKEIWGPSGAGNFFKPGATGGSPTQVYAYKKGDPAYTTDYKAFAPSFGFAWTPRFSGGWLGKLVGESGQTVIRGGVSVAYNRYSMGDYSSMFAANPGSSITANRSQDLGNLITNTGTDVWPLLYRDKSRLSPPKFAEAPVFPMIPTIDNSINAFDPNIRTPYTISWTLGIQREITKDTVVEVRYVANRNLQPWYQPNFNEINLVENGWLNEFKLAQANLQANIAAGRGNTFKYSGPNTGTSPLPTLLAYTAGLPAANAGDTTKYTSTYFTNATAVGTLAKTNAAPGTLAGNLYGDATRRANAAAAGLPANQFLINPAVQNGGGWLFMNGGYTYYDSLQIDLRRRMAKGLMVQGNYVYSKALEGYRVSFREGWKKRITGNLPHAFKVNWIYELPFGRNRALFNGMNPVLNHIFGNWDFQGMMRWQSGNLINPGNVKLVGATDKEFQKMLGVYHNDSARISYYVPQDVIKNTIAAYNTSSTTSNGYSTAFGAPTGIYFAPANSDGCIQVTAGQCAPNYHVFRGPRFIKWDLSLLKKVYFTETANFEFRAEVLNAFNDINFYGNVNPGSSQTWGQVTSGFRDMNQAQDPGGRLIQLAARINW